MMEQEDEAIPLEISMLSTSDVKDITAVELPELSRSYGTIDLEVAARRALILYERDYQHMLRSLIERDYFPDLERLRLQVEYARAKDKGDEMEAGRIVEALNRKILAQLQAEVQADCPVVNVPRTGKLSTIDKLRRAKAEMGIRERPSPSNCLQVATTDKRLWRISLHRMNLEGFHRRFSSEDNASFRNMMIEHHRNCRENRRWMEREAELSNIRNLRLRLSAASQGNLSVEPFLESRGRVIREGLGFSLVRASDHIHRIPGTSERKEMVVVVREKGDHETSGLRTAPLVAEPHLFFQPNGRNQMACEERLSAVATRFDLNVQGDNPLGRKSQNPTNRRKNVEALAKEVEERANNWVEEGGRVPRGITLLQYGERGAIERWKLINDEQIGFQFMASSDRERVALELADRVLQKRRDQVLATSEGGRRLRAASLRSAASKGELSEVLTERR